VRVLKKQSGLLDREFTPHTCRDIFKTECDHAGVKDNISEFFIRHALDKYGYNRLDKMYAKDFEKEYAKVEPALNIYSGQQDLVNLEERIKELEKESKMKTKVLKSFIETIEPYKEVVKQIDALPKEERKIVQKTIKEISERILDEYWRKKSAS